MTRRHVVVMGGVCALILAGGQRDADAQVATPFNVRSLPAPCTSATGEGTDLDPDPAKDTDTEAFKCAIGLVPSSGGEIYIPAGRYKLTETLSILNKHITFRGEGQRLTNLEWHATTDYDRGINFRSDCGSVHHTLNVRSLSILRAVGTGGTGITAWWRPTSSSPMDYGGTSATLFDVHVSGKSDGVYWSYGVYVDSAVGARIHSFNIDSPGARAEGASILIAGKSIGVTVSDGNMGNFDRGVSVTGESESVRIENVETSLNIIGYFFQTGKHHSITNSHAGGVDTGIQFNDSSDAVISGNFLLLVRTGILIWNPGIPGARFQVRDNLITTDGASGVPLDPYAISITGTVTDTVVMGNQVKFKTLPNDPLVFTTIYLGPAVSNSLVVGNYLRTHGVVHSPGNVVEGNH